MTMTDNEIIKALELCAEAIRDASCTDCPYGKQEDGGCIVSLCRDSLDLIHRQKAEIDSLREDSKRLKKVQMQLDDLCIMHHIIRAEAIKEFAKEIHNEIEKALTNNYEVRGKRMANLGVAGTDEFVSQCTGKIYALRGIDEFIDNLVKEMVGDNNG